MKLSLRKPLVRGGSMKAMCVPLLFSLVMQETAIASESLVHLESVLTVSTASRFVNVTGTVKDSKGEPLPGVVVTIKGTQTSTATDVNGVFRMNLPTGNETLVFSFIGFATKEVAMAGRSSIDVTLEENIASLEEVVVVGYGVQKKAHLTGSVVEVNVEELEELPATNIGAALAGRVLGVGASG
ncbi:SusC/RagA family TonB-linked outer membrane protein, partial [Pseudoxanthomonas sp. SGD-10]